MLAHICFPKALAGTKSVKIGCNCVLRFVFSTVEQPGDDMPGAGPSRLAGQCRIGSHTFFCHLYLHGLVLAETIVDMKAPRKKKPIAKDKTNKTQSDKTHHKNQHEKNQGKGNKGKAVKKKEKRGHLQSTEEASQEEGEARQPT